MQAESRFVLKPGGVRNARSATKARSFRLAFALVALANLAGNGPATAQENYFPDEISELGTRFKKAPENASRDEARELQKRVARCSVYRNKELARQILINSNPASVDLAALDSDVDRLIDELDIDDCIGQAMKHSTYQMQMRFQLSTLRALFTEEVYLMDNAEPIAVKSGAQAFVNERRNGPTLDARAEVLAGLADCIVYNAPGASDALLRTAIGSKSEDGAVEALHPALRACGLGGEKEVVLDFSMLRQVVADGLWSRSYYTPGQSEVRGGE